MAEGITQHEIAQKLDLSVSTVSLLERGRCRGMDTLHAHVQKYADAMNVNLNWFLHGWGDGPVLPMKTTLTKLGKRPLRQADRIEAKLDLILKHLNIDYR